MSKYLGPEINGRFLLTFDKAVETYRQGSEEQKQLARTFDSLLRRYESASDGVDFADDTLRFYLENVLAAFGWKVDEIDAVLALGYVLESPAQLTLKRPAIQQDVDDFRAWAAQEKTRNDYQLLESDIKAAYSNGDRHELISLLRKAAESLEAG